MLISDCYLSVTNQCRLVKENYRHVEVRNVTLAESATYS